MVSRLIKVFVICIICLFTYLLFLISPASLSDEKIRFVVPMDAKNEETVARLKEQNFIRSTGAFNFLAGIMHFPGNIEPGAYLLSRRSTLMGITTTLLFKPYQKWAVLVPGLRREQVAEKLLKKFGWNDSKLKEFLDNAPEGYLFPDTYLLNVDYTGKEFTQRLVSNFNEHFTAQMQKDLLSQNEKNDTAVKVASLIERESGGDEDKSLIAGIIWNRLNDKMPLQIDATIQYAIGTPNDWWPTVLRKDLKKDSPYNTYLNKGLPPGPIASPSLTSIIAAVYPAETDCIFYLHDRAKQIHCTKTYAQHLENIDMYLR